LDQSPNSDPKNPGLLDISVELSSGELFAGHEFTVYVLVKNPFGQPLWIKNVTVSIPSEMYWQDFRAAQKDRKPNNEHAEDNRIQSNIDPQFLQRIVDRRQQIQKLQDEISMLNSKVNEKSIKSEDELVIESERKIQTLREEQSKLAIDEQLLYSQLGYNFVIAKGGSYVRNVDIRSTKPVYISTDDSSYVRDLLHRAQPAQAESEKSNIRLESSLPPEGALQPGSTGVWSIRLGTNSNIFFFPSQYRLQFNVLYSFQGPSNEEDTSQTLRVDTVAKSLNVRASLKAMMIGAFIGGFCGAFARELQVRGSFTTLLSGIGEITLSLTLSAILSVAAVIFASRKSETQAFLSVEDFWGGALIGFLIGFSGTSAFGTFTKTSSVAS
jgi:hypothetical protein